MIKIGHSADRPVDDYKLDRYACYLIAQNGDPNKIPIAIGSEVRQTIKKINGVLPERLPVEKHIKELKKDAKKLK